MIRNLNNIDNLIREEKLEVCVVSFGGSCSNLLVDTLEKNGYKCKSQSWHDLLCHCPEFIDVSIPIIYIYDNPIRSYLSVKNRGTGWWDVNQRKLSNNNEVELSDSNLLKLMLRQFFKFYKNRHNQNLLMVNSKELFNEQILPKLSKFLNNDDLKEFPIEYKQPNTVLKLDCISESDVKLLKKNLIKIEKICNYKTI